MLLSAHEIAHSREHALNNLLGLSAACIEAGQQLSEIIAATGRDALHHGSKHWAQFGHGQIESLAQFPATAWLENSSRTSRLLDNALAILGHTHKAMIRNAEAQVRVFDELTFATINRLARSSPWEIEIGLQAMKATLQAAESGLHDISTAAIDSVELAGKHERLDSDGESRPASRKRGAPRAGTDQ